jgi:hypothetical protein
VLPSLRACLPVEEPQGLAYVGAAMANFFALLCGVIAALFSVGAVIALWISATNADTHAAELAKETEELKAKNLAFEEAISPRILEQHLTANKLESFSDIYVRVVSPSDFEPKRTAGQIRFMLSVRILIG